MKIEIYTPEEKVFEGEAEHIRFPGSNGSFGVLKNHAPMISTLNKGQIEITNNENTEEITIESGVVEINNNIIIVLAESV
jgi:F-type H+-transporting ATPase subunit epsilon